MKIALLGNPGAGKSLIFNQLTGLGIEVNRYPGSSVCLECGNVCYKKEKIEIIDLPGIYSLDGSSEEEVLVRKFLEEAKADIIVAVLDATKLERNLYLFTQVTEFTPRLIVVVNKIDEAERQGLIIDSDQLSGTARGRCSSDCCIRRQGYRPYPAPCPGIGKGSDPEGTL